MVTNRSRENKNRNNFESDVSKSSSDSILENKQGIQDQLSNILNLTPIQKSLNSSQVTKNFKQEQRSPRNENETYHIERQQKIREGLFMHDDKHAFIKAAKEQFNTIDVDKFVEHIVKILQTKKQLRSNDELKRLVPLIKDIPFFKERQIEGPILLDLVGCMEYMNCEKDQYVFEYGDLGEYFYLILSGSVEIQIPDFRKKEIFL